MNQKLDAHRLPECAGLIVGGGLGSRFGGDKLTVAVAGKPLLAWSLLAFEHAPEITAIVLVAPFGRSDEFNDIARAAGISKLAAVVTGGSKRHESVINGLAALSSNIELVAIHDAARPLVTPSLIKRCLEVAAVSGAAVAATPVTDTLHQADREGCAVRTVDRTGLWAMQTPQVFRAVQLAELLAGTKDEKPTDETSVALAAGWRVPFVENLQPNPKVTWQSDLPVAETLLLAATRSL